MDKKETEVQENGHLALVSKSSFWKPTMRLRWKGNELQQKWQCIDGKEKWLPIEAVAE